jgi:1,4-dihydroxy-2-naphthoate polyprenyltransferase
VTQPGNPATMTPWVLAARPKTLSAAVVPVLIGTALAPAPIRWLMFACALLGALFIQIGTNLVNDALDYKKGADTGERLGPVRVTQAGLLSAEAVMRFAFLCFVLAALFGVPLMLLGGWVIVAIGVTSIAAAYAYTGGPYPLAYNGLGELFVMIFFGVVAVGGSYYVQTLTIDKAVIIAGFAAGSLACVLLVINNLRDIESDRVSNKKTMAVRFGEGFARFEVAFFVIAPFILAMFVAQIRHRDWLLLPLAAFPMALALINKTINKTKKAVGRELNRCLALAGAMQWIFGILFVIGTRIS